MNIVVALLFSIGWLGTSHFLPWISWHAEVPFFLGAFLVAWVAILARGRSVAGGDIVFPAPAWPLAILLTAAAWQGLSGQIVFWGDAFVFCLYVLLCMVCLALGYAAVSGSSANASRREGHPPLLSLSLIVLFAGVVSVVVALAQVLQVWESSPWILRQHHLRRPGANLGQPNHLATLLVMAIASLAYLHSLKRVGGLLTATLVLLLCGGVALTESRTGALSVFALLFWWAWKQPLVAPDRSRGWVVGIGALFVLMFGAWPKLFGAFHGVKDAALRLGVEAGNARADVWPQLWEAALQRPWLGWGALQTAHAHNSVGHAYEKSAPFSYSHNLILDLVVWVGFPLAGLLVVMGALWLLRRALDVRSVSPWYGLAIALPVGVHSMLEFPFVYAYFLVPVMFAVGAMEGSLGQRSRLRVAYRPALAAFFVVTVVSAWSVVEYLQAEDDFRVARFELLRIGQTPAEHERPTILLQTQLAALLNSSRIEPRPGMPEPELELLKKVAMRYPWSATQYRYALSLALNHQEDEAARQMRILRAQQGDRTYFKLQAQITDQVNRSSLRQSGAGLKKGG